MNEDEDPKKEVKSLKAIVTRQRRHMALRDNPKQRSIEHHQDVAHPM
jgi:hypothetical protein